MEDAVVDQTLNTEATLEIYVNLFFSFHSNRFLYNCFLYHHFLCNNFLLSSFSLRFFPLDRFFIIVFFTILFFTIVFLTIVSFINIDVFPPERSWTTNTNRTASDDVIIAWNVFDLDVREADVSRHNGAHLDPLGAILMWCSEGFQGGT